MRKLIKAACGLVLGVAPMAQAQDVVVVELFTSQGCVSCPPADEFFAELAKDPRLIPLSLHVDYWDYIGWEDGLADPRYTARQKEYARAIGSRTIYTPQFIVEGQDRIEGLSPEATLSALTARLAEPSPVTLKVARQGDQLQITAEADPPLTAPVWVQLVRYEPEVTVAIERGENAGKTVSYHNVVTSWDLLGDWQGSAPLAVNVTLQGDQPGVVILQNQGPAGILAAAKVD